LPDIKEYIKRTYSKKFYSEEEVNELIALIKKNIE
jgi:cell division septum initiation protein DivIVA